MLLDERQDRRLEDNTFRVTDTPNERALRFAGVATKISNTLRHHALEKARELGQRRK